MVHQTTKVINFQSVLFFYFFSNLYQINPLLLFSND